MKRRHFLHSAGAAAAVAVLPETAQSQPLFDPQPGAWRTYEIVTQVEVRRPAGRTRVWIPLPSVNEPEWVRTLGDEWSGNASEAGLAGDGRSHARMLAAEWSPATKAPKLVVASRVAVRDRAIDFSQRDRSMRLDPGTHRFYTAATELIPTHGLVRRTAREITRGATGDLDKAHAIYEWMIDHTFRDPTTRGCGTGDVRAMLETGNLGGKCADLSALYVALARASGLAARDVYGIRVAPSRFGFKSLGAASANVTKAQHCRAEVWASGYGWIPVDPADVRKVMLEEPPGRLAPNDPRVIQVRNKLFGAWEMNWLPYNIAHDISLPGSRGVPIGYLMYPQGETAQGRFDPLDPDHFSYTITSRVVNT